MTSLIKWNQMVIQNDCMKHSFGSLSLGQDHLKEGVRIRRVSATLRVALILESLSCLLRN